MRQLDHCQGTPAWHAWRRTRRTASFAPAIMAHSRHAPSDVLAYYHGEKKAFDTPATAHGRAHEGDARAYAADVLGEFLTPLCVEDDAGMYAASLDWLYSA